MATIRSIAFDAKRALFNHTGLGNYSRYAIETMQRAYPEAELSLYTRKIHRRQMHPWLKRLNMPRLVTPDRGTLLPALWRHWRGMTGALRRDRPDVYHGLSNELPFDIRRAGIPTVVTIHDLIFRRIPENYTAIDRWLYNLKFRSAARNATRIIAISERTKADIIELYGIDPAKIDVIYQGVNPIFHQPVSEETREEVRQKYGLPERYIVMVGTRAAQEPADSHRGTAGDRQGCDTGHSRSCTQQIWRAGEATDRGAGTPTAREDVAWCAYRASSGALCHG